MARRGLQVLLVLLAAVTIVAGGVTVLTGSSTVVGSGPVAPGLDSELRFYAAWYVGVGVVLLWMVPRVSTATLAVRGVCAVLLLGAVGRIISLVQVGRPPVLYLVLLVIELVLPLVLVPWQAKVASGAGEESRAAGTPTG